MDNPGGYEAQTIEDTVSLGERPVYRLQVEQLLARGYKPSIELAETAYTNLQIQRLRATMEAERAAGRDSAKQTVSAMGDLQATLRAQLADLDKRFRQGVSDPDSDLRAAELYVQEHLGEFQARCPNSGCGQILTIPALPHWAYAPVPTVDGGREWMVWSPELWALVLDQSISLWAMAFVLRTSPEALRVTALRRGETWPEGVDLGAEDLALEVRLKAMDRRAMLALAATE